MTIEDIYKETCSGLMTWHWRNWKVRKNAYRGIADGDINGKRICRISGDVPRFSDLEGNFLQNDAREMPAALRARICEAEVTNIIMNDFSNEGILENIRYVENGNKKREEALFHAIFDRYPVSVYVLTLEENRSSTSRAPRSTVSMQTRLSQPSDVKTESVLRFKATSSTQRKIKKTSKKSSQNNTGYSVPKSQRNNISEIYHRDLEDQEFGISAWEKQKRKEKLSKRDTFFEDNIICTCILFDKEYLEMISVNILQELNERTLIGNGTNVSSDSPMGKACLLAIISGQKRFSVARINYELVDCEIEDQQYIDNYRSTFRKSVVNKSDVEKRSVGFRDFLIRRDVRGCLVKGHIVKDIVAKIPLLTENGLSSIELPATYCASCNLYYISEADFQSAKRKGTLFCQILEEEAYLKLKKGSFASLAPKSVLSMMGYTVEKKNDPGQMIRQQILALIIDNNILSKADVLSYLDFFVNMRNGRKSYGEAIDKWKDDRNFVAGYKKGKYKVYGVRSITKTNYVHV